jgi:two-component system copper resistance phosphate regulon response regulator CusR
VVAGGGPVTRSAHLLAIDCEDEGPTSAFAIPHIRFVARRSHGPEVLFIAVCSVVVFVGAGSFAPSYPMTGSPETPPRFHVLLAEDEEKTRTSIGEGFRLEGWMVKMVADGAGAVESLDGERFDLLVLDWMLPGRDGLDVLRHMRARGSQTPVLMLTVRDAIQDRVAGLEAGADDYLTKPFAFAELLARSRALVRRPVLSTGQLLSFDDLQLDTRARLALRGGKQIPLTPREVDILEYLLRHQGRVVTREMLERDVWKQNRRFTSLDNVIDVQIMRLRRKIDQEGTARLLHTLRGVGYRLGVEIK